MSTIRSLAISILISPFFMFMAYVYSAASLNDSKIKSIGEEYGIKDFHILALSAERFGDTDYLKVKIEFSGKTDFDTLAPKEYYKELYVPYGEYKDILPEDTKYINLISKNNDNYLYRQYCRLSKDGDWANDKCRDEFTVYKRYLISKSIILNNKEVFSGFNGKTEIPELSNIANTNLQSFKNINIDRIIIRPGKDTKTITTITGMENDKTPLYTEYNGDQIIYHDLMITNQDGSYIAEIRHDGKLEDLDYDSVFPSLKIELEEAISRIWERETYKDRNKAKWNNKNQ